jgi:hypothetical protein
MPLPYILSRILVRTGVALWRHRLAWIFAGLIFGAFSVYQLSFAGPSVVNGDCADTTMAAVTRADDAAARAAYACLGPSMRNTSEDQFVADMRKRALPHAQVNRVADQRTADGGRIVFYTVHDTGIAVGYIVYLDPHGKVARVE